MPACRRCGTESPRGFRFCGACGARLAADAIPHETRKVVTVLFADVTGFTSLSEGLDPEALREVMHAYFREIRQTIERHGGTVEKFIGDAVMAMFGIPLAHEDDALRATRAALEIRDRMPSFAEAAGTPLRFRTGVNTGTVFTGEGETLAVGDAVNVAARLEQAAAPGEILIGAETLRLVAGLVEVEPLEPLTLKGKAQPVPAFRLLGLRAEERSQEDRAGRVPRVLGISDTHAPLVGRDAELQGARAAFERAARARRAHLLTIIGDAGIGKSRLAYELVTGLSGEATILVGRCISYGEGAALWPLRQALTGLAGGDSRDHLRALLPDDPDADVVADVSAAALGLAPVEAEPEQVPWAFRRLLQTLGAAQPVLLVVEDAHWASDRMLSLLDGILESVVAPLLVVCLARPELLERRPWGAAAERIGCLTLSALGPVEVERLLGQRLGEQRLTTEHRRRILATAEGNPLFVEQLLAAIEDDPGLAREQSVPLTIHSLLAARLDRLGPGERAYIERAAIVGRDFDHDTVVHLLPESAYASAAADLQGLVRRGLLHLHRREGEHLQPVTFDHILILDVAYRSMPKGLRSTLHEQLADLLERRGEEAREFVGYHLERAYRLRAELGRGDAALLGLAARAGEAQADAGRRALAGGDVHGGIALLRSAADLRLAADAPRAEVLLDLGVALGDSGAFDEAEEVLQAALSEAEATGADTVAARAAIELSWRGVLVDPSVPVADVLAVAEEAVAVFERAGDHAGIARAWIHVGMVHWIRSQGGEMEAVLERALEHAERAGARRERNRILGFLARACVTGPRPARDGVQRCREILGRAEGDVVLAAVAETMLAVLEAMLGEFESARRHRAAAEARLQRIGLDQTVAVMQMYAAFVELLARSPARAEAGVRAGYELLERIGEGHRRAMTAAMLARLLLEQGRLEEAAEYTRISQALASEDDVGAQASWRGAQARILAAAGEHERALELAASAVELTAATDSLMLQGNALADRAETRRLAGRRLEAAHDLDAAIELFERKGMVVSADAARVAQARLRRAPRPGQPAPASG